MLTSYNRYTRYVVAQAAMFSVDANEMLLIITDDFLSNFNQLCVMIFTLFKKENDNVCELKGGGGRPVNGIASELPMQRRGTFIVFLTMERNERQKRGYKIKGPH